MTLCEEDKHLLHAKQLLRSTPTSSDAHRAIKALLGKTMSDAQLLNHGLAGSRRGIYRARHDCKSIIVNGNLQTKKKKPRGKSVSSNLAIANSIKESAGNCSTASWSIRCHVKSINVV